MFKSKRLELLIITSLWILVWIILYAGILNDRYIINDDQHHNTAWMYNYSTNNLIENDDIIEFAEKVQPWGYWLIFSSAAKIIDPLILTKLFSLPVLITTILFLHLFLRKYFKFSLAFIGILLLFPVGIIAGSHARSFAFLFLFAFLYYYSNGKHMICGLILIISVLFYPVISLILISFYLIGEIFNLILKKKIFTRRIIIYLISILIVGSIAITKSVIIQQDKKIGRIYTKNEMISMPEFSKTGRYSNQNQINAPYHYLFDYTIKSLRKYIPVRFNKIDQKYVLKLTHIYHSLLFKISISLALILILFLWVRSYLIYPLDIDRYIIVLFLTGIILFFSATQMPDLLYFPVRYLRYTIPIWIGLVFLKFLNAADKRIVVIVFIYLGVLFLIKNPRAKGYIDYSENNNVFEFFNNVNSKTLIAGPLMISDQIPIICKKSVLFSHETSIVIFKGYWEQQKEKIFDYYSSIYTPSKNELDEFIEKYHVDYLIYNIDYFSETKDLTEFEPIGSFIMDQRSNMVEPLLNNLESEAVTYLQNGYYILDCMKYLNPSPD